MVTTFYFQDLEGVDHVNVAQHSVPLFSSVIKHM